MDSWIPVLSALGVTYVVCVVFGLGWYIGPKLQAGVRRWWDGVRPKQYIESVVVREKIVPVPADEETAIAILISKLPGISNEERAALAKHILQTRGLLHERAKQNSKDRTGSDDDEDFV